MPDSREYDVRELEDLVLPFDVTTKELSESPRIVDGSNMYITLGGKLALAPGLTDIGANVANRPDSLVLYETIESPPKVYILASFKVGSSWEVFYNRLDGTGTWTSLGTVRDQNLSTRAHQMSVARGLVYIKAFPDGSHDKYGSIIFDGSGATPHVYLWGIPGPTVAAQVSASAGWSASTNAVSVNLGWQYVYCWVSATGQYSNRSPLETAPGASSNTGAFTNKKPSLTVKGHADTTNIPNIAIFRTTDGGGTFYYLDQITNTGAGDITYVDNHRVDATTNDPKTDMQLDTANIAPSLTTNTVPPPVGPKKVIGTDQVEASSNIAYYARRFWYGIGNRLYFSGQEEILNGVPEESFPNPNGIRGNYYIVRGQVRMLKETNQGLYVITSNEILRVTGQDRTNLQINQLVGDISAAVGHPHAVAAYRDIAAFLSSDLQIIAVAPGTAPEIISQTLGDSLRSLITSDTEVIMDIFNRDGNAWLVVAVVNRVTSSLTRMFVFDTKKNLWFTPWAKSVSCFAFGRLRESDARNHLVVLTWTGSAGKLCVLDPDVNTDAGTAYAPDVTLNLVSVPPGNHINSLRQPAHHPMLSFLMAERTKFTSDTEPTVEYRLDEFSGALTTAVAKDPPFIKQRSSYQINWYPVQEVVQRVQLRISKPAVNEKFELQTIGFVFQSEAGS